MGVGGWVVSICVYRAVCVYIFGGIWFRRGAVG